MERHGRWLPILIASVCLTFVATAQAQVIEEVIVTGSYIRGTPEDAASPVQILDRTTMDDQGNPSLVEMIKRLGPVSGVDGDQNQFQSNGLEAISNVNLRGLGPGRTLVLLNGTRMVPTPFPIPETGQQFVNTNVIPSIALERIELLKDGASATYGSDAVAGVANFITRSNFRGIEFQGSFKGIDDSEDDGDWDGGLIAGLGTDRLDVVASFGYQYRSKVKVREIGGWALQSIGVNPRGGFSSIGSPGTYIPLDDPSPTDLADGGYIADPDCELVGGHQGSSLDVCRFRYTDFDNLAEEEEHYQFFVEGTYDVTDTMSLHGEFLYARDETDNWNTSPSFPPQALTGLDRVQVPGMPAFDDFIARNPGLTTHGEDFDGDGETLEDGVYVWGRFQGVSGPEQEGDRKYDTWRLSVGLDGLMLDDVTYYANVAYSTSEIDINSNDSRVDNVAWAYRGLGGPDCDPATGTSGSGNAGTGDCWYYNPFTSGYTASQSTTATGATPPGSENSELNNPAFMQSWLTEFLGGKTETKLFVADVVFTGESQVVAPGGNVGWALGAQYRRDEFSDDLLASTDAIVQPCAFGLEASGDTFTIDEIDLGGGNSIPSWTYRCGGSGAFHFLAAGVPADDDQDVYALFSEFAIPLTDNLNVQVAVRYEDYGGSVGDTVDPKLAATWDAFETIRLRASIGSSFRAPGLNQLSGVGTSLQFVAPTGAFKAIDTTGNPNIGPEEAITKNFGVIWQPTDSLYFSLDYWDFKFSDPIVLESAGDVVAECTDTDSPINGLACGKITFQDPDNPLLASIERIAVTYQAGPDLETNGVDYLFTWDLPTDFGDLTFGTQGTYINEYKIDSWIWAGGFDAEGDLNRFQTNARPLPELKNNAWVNWQWGDHNVRIDSWYTDSYDDRSEPDGADWSIDDVTTYDISYNFRFNNGNGRLFVSVYNFTDEDPPLARLDLNYDPYTHNAFGTMWKVGVAYRLEAGVFQ